MKKSAILMLGLAVGLGAVSVYLARDWIEQQTQAVVVEEHALPVTTVVVADRQLEFGDPLMPEYLKVIEWPASSIPGGAFASLDELYSDGRDRVALRTIFANEPILNTKISGSGEKATLSRLISADMRAVTVRVNDVVGVAGFILPGDRVDVVVTRNRGNQEPITDTVMQNVKVLGIDQETSEDKDKPVVARAVTLEVTPEQAQKLALAAQVGQITLTLRNEENLDLTPVRTVREHDLSATAPSPQTKGQTKGEVSTVPAQPRSAQVTVIRGLKATVEEVGREKGYLRAQRPATGSPLPLKLPEKRASSAADDVKDKANGAMGAVDSSSTDGGSLFAQIPGGSAISDLALEGDDR